MITTGIIIAGAGALLSIVCWVIGFFIFLKNEDAGILSAAGLYVVSAIIFIIGVVIALIGVVQEVT